MDNTLAVCYLNHRGGITSPSLNYLAKENWQGCMSRNISLVANQLPGHLNTVVDTEYRMIRDRWDWQFYPSIFHKINQKWGPFAVDLFAIQTDTSTAYIFQLKTRPSGSSNQCFPPSVATKGRPCKSSMGSDVEGAIRNQPWWCQTSNDDDWLCAINCFCIVLIMDKILWLCQFCWTTSCALWIRWY